MRYLIHLALLLTLCSTHALANDTQQVELIIFRQSSQTIPASQVAPDNWANGATPVTREMLRSTQLDHFVKKLTPANGYQVLLHKAWLQTSNGTSVQVAVSEGTESFAHYPVEGTISMELERTSQVQMDFWINQFNPDATLLSSERFKQSALVANDQVTFIDHGTLGALIRIQAQGNKSADSSANSASQYLE
ncbi:MAG: hypothetical protein GXX06_02630 [Gammaproteobacteria bacterium]|nr:hypothetical protein [Gammaproteobacteria bacterium]